MQVGNQLAGGQDEDEVLGDEGQDAVRAERGFIEPDGAVFADAEATRQDGRMQVAQVMRIGDRGEIDAAGEAGHGRGPGGAVGPFRGEGGGDLGEIGRASPAGADEVERGGEVGERRRLRQALQRGEVGQRQGLGLGGAHGLEDAVAAHDRRCCSSIS